MAKKKKSKQAGRTQARSKPKSAARKSTSSGKSKTKAKAKTKSKSKSKSGKAAKKVTRTGGDGAALDSARLERFRPAEKVPLAMPVAASTRAPIRPVLEMRVRSSIERKVPGV